MQPQCRTPPVPCSSSTARRGVVTVKVVSLQEAEAPADFSSGEALRPRQLGLDPPPFPDPGHLYSVPTAGSPASIFLFRTKRPMQQQDRTPPSPSSSLETLQRHTDQVPPLPRCPSPPPDPPPKRGVAVWLSGNLQGSNHCPCLSIQGEPALLPFLSGRLA